MSEIVVPVTVLPHGEGLDLPAYATAGAAGCDLRAAVTEPVTLQPGARALVPTGLALAIPHGFEGQVRMRSGLAISSGLALLNAPGTIDSDYRGEVKVILANLGAEPVTLLARRAHRSARVRAGDARQTRARRSACADARGESGRFRLDGPELTVGHGLSDPI